MNETDGRCPGCGAELEPGACDGLCPVCLMSGAMAPTAGGTAGCPGPGVPALESVQAAFPHLEVVRLIGSGGMGSVFLARQPQLDRLIALKVIPAQGSAGGHDFAARFEREGRLLARLHHPNIVTVHDSGRAGDFYYLIMEYVEGVTLREAMRAARFAPAEALALVPKICEALQYAHDEGILHRDIKPENILLDRRGRVKLADFGIAKLMGPRTTADEPSLAGESPSDPTVLTKAGALLGTPRYMAPEQAAQPDEVDHRADIYSLGVVFYELLTGELPPAPFSPPSERADVDRRIDAIVEQALERERRKRQQSAAELKTQVERVTPKGGEISGYPPRAAFAGSWEYVSRRRILGLPLLHVTRGTDPETGRPRVARGVFAVGDVAQGVVTFGGRAYGVFAFGGIAIGVIALGGVALGIVAFAGLALGLLLAHGGLAVGTLAAGGLAIGWYAVGGGSFGYSVAGGFASGVQIHFHGGTLPFPLRELDMLLFRTMRLALVVWIPAIAGCVAVSAWAAAQVRRNLPQEGPVRFPQLSFRWKRLAGFCWLAAIPFWIGCFVWLVLQESHPVPWRSNLDAIIPGIVMFPVLLAGMALTAELAFRMPANAAETIEDSGSKRLAPWERIANVAWLAAVVLCFASLVPLIPLSLDPGSWQWNAAGRVAGVLMVPVIVGGTALLAWGALRIRRDRALPDTGLPPALTPRRQRLAGFWWLAVLGILTAGFARLYLLEPFLGYSSAASRVSLFLMFVGVLALPAFGVLLSLSACGRWIPVRRPVDRPDDPGLVWSRWSRLTVAVCAIIVTIAGFQLVRKLRQDAPASGAFGRAPAPQRSGNPQMTESGKRWIEAARRELEVARMRHQSGMADMSAVIRAEAGLAVAEANGDPLAIARANRDGDAKLLEIVRMRHEAGVETQESVESLRARIAAHEAEIERLTGRAEPSILRQ